MQLETGLCLSLSACLLAGCNRGGLPGGQTPVAGALDSVCGFDPHADATKAVLAFTVDHDLRFTFADGSTRTVYTFATQLPSPNTTFIGRVDDARAGRVIVDGSTYYSPPGQPGQIASELVLLDRAGTVLWHRTAPGFGTPYLGADGTLTVWDTNQETLVVRPDGTTRAVAGKWSPVAAAPDGSLLVQDPPPNGDDRLGWLRPGRDTVETLAIQPMGYEEWVGDRLAYVGKQDGNDVLVLATPDESRIVALPDGSGTGLAFAGAAGDWMEVQRYGAETPTMMRVNVRTGDVEAVLQQLPAGLRSFDGGTFSYPQLADDGSLLSSFRNDYIGNLYRSTDLGATWAPLGFSVANVQGLGLIASSGGTFVAQSVQQFYAPDSPWSDPPGGVSPELSGQFTQLIRPSEGVRYQLPSLAGYRPVALGSSGRCAAYWTIGSDKMTGQLEVLEVPHSRRTTIVDNSDVRAAQAPFWLER
jgi:hypothetical protein